ncbi:MAG: hypothetical protein RTU92_09525 [Candidatus Thorarchaeota archaeon]
MEDPRITILLKLRRELDEELEELRTKVALLEDYLQALDATIGTGSFATADTAIGVLPEPPGPSIDSETTTLTAEARTITVRAKDKDMELATIEVDGDQIKIIPVSHAIYDIKRGAFARFFVEKILGTFQQEDRVNVENGIMEWDEAFDFEVRAEDGILQEIVIRNFGDDSRLSEIERTLRWALEKVYRAR